MTEEELIKGCIKQSRIAQKELFYLYHGQMVKICLSYCKNEDDAKWVANQGFMDVFLNIKSFKGQSSLKTWIVRIMINKALRFYRNEQAISRYHVYTDNILQMVPDNAVLDECIIQKMEYEDIIKLVQELPDNERMVFSMFVLDGFSHKEIASVMDIPEGTCRWHLSNAKKILQGKLKKNDNERRVRETKDNIKTGV